MKIGYKSDIHLDFWVKNTNQKKKIENFIKKMLAPQKMDVLIIAGDLGHFNYQNILLIEVLREYASSVLVSFGNHDLYLVSKKQKEKYKSSFNRLLEFKEMLKKFDNVFFLDGDLVEIDGVRFLGAGGWYDFSLALKYGISLDRVYKEWESVMNDAKMIVPKINPVEFSFIQKEKIRKNISKADIVFTHVPPVYVGCYDDVFLNAFYTFYGYDLLEKNLKYWIFGHCHTPCSMEIEGVNLLSSPLGYPEGRKGERYIKYLEI